MWAVVLEHFKFYSQSVNKTKDSNPRISSSLPELE